MHCYLPKGNSTGPLRSTDEPGTCTKKCRVCDCEMRVLRGATYENGMGVVKMRSRPVSASTSWFRALSRLAVLHRSDTCFSQFGAVNDTHWLWVGELRCGLGAPQCTSSNFAAPHERRVLRRIVRAIRTKYREISSGRLCVTVWLRSFARMRAAFFPWRCHEKRKTTQRYRVDTRLNVLTPLGQKSDE